MIRCAKLPLILAASFLAACTTTEDLGPIGSDTGGGADFGGGRPGTGGASTSNGGGGGSDKGGGSATSGTGGNQGGLPLVVTPNKADILTCGTQQFAATVDGQAPTKINWAVSGGDTSGKIDASGLYTAPTKVPVGLVTLTASVPEDAVKIKPGHASITLATARPQPSVKAFATAYADSANYQHKIAGNGAHAYAVETTKSGANYSVQVTRSDDGGATWLTPTTVNDNTDPTAPIDCSAVAVDAADSNTIYVAYRFNVDDTPSHATKDVSYADGGGSVLALGVSVDAGKTFKSYVLASDTTPGQYTCPDVVSTSGNTVVVSGPIEQGASVYYFSDADRGAGFATGSGTPLDYAANGVGKFGEPSGTTVGMSKGELPRLFTDGAHNVCVTYVATSSSKSNAVVRCNASDGTGSFGSETVLDPNDSPSAETPTLPNGAFGPNGAIAIAYGRNTKASDTNHVFVALSTDAGKTFSSPVQRDAYAPAPSAALSSVTFNGSVLWLAYQANAHDGSTRIVVDKSCDAGQTWSGPVLASGTEGGTLEPLIAPGLFSTSNGIAIFSLASTTAGGESAIGLE